MHEDRSEEEPWPWLDDRPVFTTRGEKGGNATRVPAGAVLDPIRPGLALLVIGLAAGTGSAIAGAGLIIAGLSEVGAAALWWLTLVVPAVALSVVCGAGVFVRGMELFMRERPRTMLLSVGLLAGPAAGLGALSVRSVLGDGGAATAATVLGVESAVAAVAAGVCLGLAARGARRARQDVRRILRLRVSGARWQGEITGLPDPTTWDRGGDVPVRYRDDRGDHTIQVRLNTYAHEIPVPGTAVTDFSDGDGDLLVELDPDQPLEFHPDNRPYESDSSGGGTM